MNDVIQFAQVMIVIIGSVASLTVIALVARILWRKGSNVQASVPAPDPRMQELQTAVEAIAIEVERISEAQRFTVGLLADRLANRPADLLGEPAARPVRRSDTPH